MHSAALYRLAKEILFPLLKEHEFTERKGKYLRIFRSNVVHLIGLAKDPHGAETFMVMCGVDALALRDENGNFAYAKHDGCHHLTDSGWHYNSGRWPCATEEEGHASLLRIRILLHDLALPWLDQHETISSVADEIDDLGRPMLGWIKARLYMLDGDIPQAREAIERYAAWAAKPRNWGTKEYQQEDIARAEQVRQEIEAAANDKGD